MLWKKRSALALILCLTVILLCGCAQEQTTYPEAGTVQRATAQPVRQADVLQTVTEAPSVQIDFPDDYDPDEEIIDDNDDEAEDDPFATYASYMSANHQYAGATPIPLDPVDMPTPTPRPDLEFEYETYETAMGYQFEAPSGWTVETNNGNTFVLRDPDTYDDVNATFTLTKQGVSSSYSSKDLRNELSSQLTQLQRNYVGWRVWQADARKLLKSDGYYNAYRGVTFNDTIVRGLVHVALVDRSVLTLSYAAPGYYNNSYQRVYNRIRNTIQ